MQIVWRSRAKEVEEATMDSFPQPILRLLAARGFYQKKEIERLLAARLSELRDPFLMMDMDLAVERLFKAFQNQESVCIYADFDLDGTSGLALLGTGLKELGFKNLVYFQPLRLSEGYGFHGHIVESLAEQGVKLIVTVDVGITAFDACKRAKDLGLDVIVTDHHKPKSELPEALAVVNPNRQDDKSNLGYLAGAGVAFYLLRALKRKLVDEKICDERTLDLKSVLDYLTIATLTDMVPLIEDNRTLVKHGLYQLQHTKRAGLRALLESLNLTERPLSSQDVAIRFAPKLNALSRMELGTRPLDIMLEENSVRAKELIKTVLSNNSTRVQLQSDGEEKALEMLESWPHKDFVFLFSEDFHKGVVGLIATKISQIKNVPTWVGSLSEGVIAGSGRLPSGYAGSLLKIMKSAEGLWTRFGGHDAAAGFEILEDKANELTEKFETYFKKNNSGQTLHEIFYDLDLSLADVSENFMKWIESLGPFGQSFDVPVFRLNSVIVKDVYSLRGGHLKLKIEDSYLGLRKEALYFSPPKNIEITKDLPYDILGELQWNYFNGSKSIQVLVKDMVRSSVQTRMEVAP